jgi:hypothetical protein
MYCRILQFDTPVNLISKNVGEVLHYGEHWIQVDIIYIAIYSK